MSARRAISDLLGRIERAGIRLWVDGERLRFDVPEGAMTTELLGFRKNGSGRSSDFSPHGNVCSRGSAERCLAAVDRDRARRVPRNLAAAGSACSTRGCAPPEAVAAATPCRNAQIKRMQLPVNRGRAERGIDAVAADGRSPE